MRKILSILLAMALLFSLSGCKEKKIVICDGCGTELKVDADSNMEDEWIILCRDCQVPEEGIY